MKLTDEEKKTLSEFTKDGARRWLDDKTRTEDEKDKKTDEDLKRLTKTLKSIDAKNVDLDSFKKHIKSLCPAWAGR